MSRFTFFFHAAGLLLTLGFPALSQEIRVEGSLYLDENGRPYTGEYLITYAAGGKRAIYNIKVGLASGRVEFYHQNGMLAEAGYFSNGIRDGLWEQWNTAGGKIGEARYIQGKKHGTWIIWDDRGIKRYEMKYDLGKKAGTWFAWDESGKLVDKRNY